MSWTPEQETALTALRQSSEYFDLTVEPGKVLLDGDFTAADLRLLADALDSNRS